LASERKKQKIEFLINSMKIWNWVWVPNEKKSKQKFKQKPKISQHASPLFVAICLLIWHRCITVTCHKVNQTKNTIKQNGNKPQFFDVKNIYN